VQGIYRRADETISLPEPLKPATVETEKSILSADPNKAGTILEQGTDDLIA
jgi:hypothetical protein